MYSIESHSRKSIRSVRQRCRTNILTTAPAQGGGSLRWGPRELLWLILLLSLAIPLRAFMLFADMTPTGDAAARYYPLAYNLLMGHGFSTNLQPPYQPNDFDLPGYPGFVAGILWLFGRLQSVVFIQLMLELLTLFVVGRIVRRLNLPGRVQTVTLVIGLLCPFLPLWAARMMTEVVTTCLALIMCYMLVRVCDEHTRYKFCWWTLAGLVGGAVLLMRPDMIIAVPLMLLATALVTWRGGWRQWLRTSSGLSLGVLAVGLMLLPWTLRSYALFGVFQPIGRVGDQGLNGYVKWLGTWVDGTNYQKPYWWDILKPIGPDHFPRWKFSTAEQQKAERILVLAKRLKTFDGEPSRQFMELANEAQRVRPLQARLIAPLGRVMNTWSHMPEYIPLRALPGFIPTTPGLPTPAQDRAIAVFYVFWKCLSWLFIIGGLYALTLRRKGIAVIFALVIGRSLLPFASGLAVEPRYLMEALPVCFVFAALGVEALFLLAITMPKRLPAIGDKLKPLHHLPLGSRPHWQGAPAWMNLMARRARQVSARAKQVNGANANSFVPEQRLAWRVSYPSHHRLLSRKALAPRRTIRRGRVNPLSERSVEPTLAIGNRSRSIMPTRPYFSRVRRSRTRSLTTRRSATSLVTTRTTTTATKSAGSRASPVPVKSS
ncbi:MAG: glycosyltransferase family 39 protein [Abitibacteriaceae bacterium]|nr:glycosyltransferase family 39 protein [Abditibacteriaceae bacterium]